MKLLLILALIVNLTGYGEIPAEGADTTVTEVTQDPLTGQALMLLEGTLLSSGPLSVTITRSQSGLSDEFCCAGQCTAGNGQTTEQLDFTPEGVVNWFIHYTPAAGSDETIRYVFSDTQDTAVLTVRYDYTAQGMETVKALPHREGVYTLTGAKVGETIENVPAGTYVFQGKTMIKSY